jgi:hypothetical protein
MGVTKMLKSARLLAGLIATATLLCIPAIRAQGQNPSRIPLTTTVTVLGPKFTAPPPLTRQDVLVFSRKTRLDVINWTPAQGQKAPLQLAIVIDNSASQLGVGSQLQDIAGFISLQSRGTAVGVFYAVNGTVQTAANFTTNHDAAAKALRLTLGPRAGDSPSVYLSVSDLIKNRWPNTGARREILLISSGIDRLDQGPQSPYVAAAIEDVQKAGVVVHAIYTGGGRFSNSFRGQFAQSNLVMLTDGSGGYNFYEGIGAPVSFTPYLKQLDMVLHNQFLLTFAIAPSGKSKGELKPIDIRTEQHNVDLKYPKLVLVPGQPR